MLGAVPSLLPKLLTSPRIPIGIVLVLLSAPISAEPEIHRCPQEDGTVAFQETPCAEAAATEAPADDQADVPVAASDDFFDFENPYDRDVEEALEEEPVRDEAPLPPPVSQNRAECEKITRDAIDAIDLEMRRGYSAGDAEGYKAELMTLTRQLRACKQL